MTKVKTAPTEANKDNKDRRYTISAILPKRSRSMPDVWRTC